MLQLHTKRVYKDRNVESFESYLDELVERKGVESYFDLDTEQSKALTALYLRDVTDRYDQHEVIINADYSHELPKFISDLLLNQLDITSFFKSIETNMLSYYQDSIEDKIRSKVAAYKANQRWNYFDEDKEARHA